MLNLATLLLVSLSTLAATPGPVTCKVLYTDMVPVFSQKAGDNFRAIPPADLGQIEAEVVALGASESILRATDGFTIISPDQAEVMIGFDLNGCLAVVVTSVGGGSAPSEKNPPKSAS